MFLIAQLPTELLKQQLGNGLVLTVLGMGIVFLFLTILVFTTKAVSAIVKRIDSRNPVVVAPQKVTAAPVSSSDSEVAAAILAAVMKSKN